MSISRTATGWWWELRCPATSSWRSEAGATFTGSGVLNQWDDWDLWIRCVKAGAGIVKVPDAVYVAHVGDSPHYTRTPEQTQAWLKEIREANGI